MERAFFQKQALGRMVCRRCDTLPPPRVSQITVDMKVVNTMIMINPSFNRKETEEMVSEGRADQFILIDADLDFADHLAQILESRRRKVKILRRLEGLEGLFLSYKQFQYKVVVKCYGASEQSGL